MRESDIIRMAHEASPDMTWYAAVDDPTNAAPAELAFLTRFAEIVCKAERSACVEIADHCADAGMHAAMAANAIRARGDNA